MVENWAEAKVALTENGLVGNLVVSLVDVSAVPMVAKMAGMMAAAKVGY